MHEWVWEGVWDLSWYKLMGFVGAYFIMFFNDRRVFKEKRPIGYRNEVVFARLYRYTRSKKFITVATFSETETFTAIYMFNMIFNWVFGDFFDTGANYFGTLVAVPVLWILLSIYYGHNPLVKLDFMTLCLPIYLIFAKFGCFMAGCCYGIPWEYGLYNEKYGQEKQVPIQLIEAALALIIYFLLKKISKKAKVGTLFPIYLMLYCGTRFFSEFLRNEENILGPFKMYHLLCVAGFVVGIILFFTVPLFSGKICEYYDKKYAEAKEITDKIESENPLYFEYRDKQKAEKESAKRRKAADKEKQKILKEKRKVYRHSKKL